MSGQYTRAWRQYARRRTAVIGAIISGPALTATPPSVATVLGLVWLALCLWTTGRLFSFRCPRCGNPFFFKFPQRNAFARRCLHCGLAKFADDDPGTA